jgi:hypothetical protein
VSDRKRVELVFEELPDGRVLVRTEPHGIFADGREFDAMSKSEQMAFIALAAFTEAFNKRCPGAIENAVTTAEAN